ncbi:MAG: hypothetical protein WAS54_01615 [Scrofimicrobium sp.]
MTQEAVGEGPAVPKPKGRPRLLGWDIFRFWGAFAIFMGHNIALAFAVHLGENAVPTSPLQIFVHPQSSSILIFTAVPVFVMLSGYFALGRPPREGEWDKAKSSFWKYIVYYWKWLVLALVLFLTVPAIWPAYTPFADQSIGDNFLMVLRNFVNASLYDPGIISPVALNWFIVGLAWLALLAPVMRRFFHQGDMKMIRSTMVILTLFMVIFPFIRAAFTPAATAHPESILLSFGATLNPLNWMLSSWWIVCFMAGGWLAVDKAAQEFIRRMKWAVVIGLTVVALFIQGIVRYYTIVGGAGLDDYTNGGWMFSSVMYVIIAYKLNFVIKPDSRVGRFTSSWGTDALGAMIVGWMFGPAMLTGVFGPVMDWMVTTFWNPSSPMVLTLVWWLFNIVYFIVVFCVVHLLKRVPIVQNMFLFRGDAKPSWRGASKVAVTK